MSIELAKLQAELDVTKAELAQLKKVEAGTCTCYYCKNPHKPFSSEEDEYDYAKSHGLLDEE